MVYLELVDYVPEARERQLARREEELEAAALTPSPALTAAITTPPNVTVPSGAGEARPRRSASAARPERQQLEGDDDDRGDERDPVMRDEEGQRVEDSAHECADAGDRPADDWIPAAGELSGVR